MKWLFVPLILLFLTSCSHHPHHNKLKKFDKDQDGKISKAEWSQKFDKKDLNGDGFLTMDEMKKWKKHKCSKSSCSYKKGHGKKNCAY
jgi:Ca2+-binding EF-hand superfamily protein